MDATVVSTLEFQYENEIPRVLELTLDIQTTRLNKIRTTLITQCCPEGPIDPKEWIFEVDGKEVGFMDAANRFGRLGMSIRLARKGGRRILELESEKKGSGGKKRERIEEENTKAMEKIYKETAGIPYETTRHLTRILKQNGVVFKREVESNGVLHQWIFMMMGHISVKIPKVALPIKSDRLLFNTEPNARLDNNLEFVMRLKQDERKTTIDTIAVCPYLTMRHVAVMCYDKRRDRLLHFDSSSTLIPINRELFQNKGRFKSVSYTFINYQAYDDTDFITNLAGGNCGMFSGLNAIQCILKYNPEPVSFGAFWERFLQVLKLTDATKQARIVVELTKRIQYVLLGGETEDFCSSVLQMDPCPLHLLSNFPRVIRLLNLEWVETCDFTCDYIMLGYFLDANIGFDQVTKLGNAFRLLLQDIVESGFVSFNIRDAMDRLCSHCEMVEAQFRCSHCSDSETKYCGRECQEMHWNEHKKRC